MKPESGFDTVFGIGFRVGFLVVLVGVLMFYFSMFTANVEVFLGYSEVWATFLALPNHIKFIVVGVALMGVAVVMSVLRENVEDFINLLFYNDRA